MSGVSSGAAVMEAPVNGAQKAWAELAQATATRMAVLDTSLRRPLPEGDIRSRQGKGYLSGGDILMNLIEDFGPLGYETTIKRLEWTQPRVDVREREIDKRTGEVLKSDTGWTCVAVCVLTVVYSLPDGRKVCREGSGTCSSDMQQSPEASIENAVKGAETDALKRACVGLGPRYGLALRFNDRDDNRVALGLIEKNVRVEEARRKRDEALAAQNKTKAETGSVAPEAPAPRTQPPAGASPAGSHTKAPAGSGPPGSGAPPAGPAPAGSSTPPVNRHAADDAARREALRKAEGQALPEVVAARSALMKDLLSIKDEYMRERVKNALMAAKDLTSVQSIEKGIGLVLDKQAKVASEAAAAKKPDPTPAPAAGPGAAAPAPATAAGASAAPAAAPAATTGAPDPHEATLRAARRICALQVDPELVTALRMGCHPGNRPPEGLPVEFPPDVTEDDLATIGWAAPGASAADLALMGASDPVPMPLQQALIAEGVKRLTRDGFVKPWKVVGGPGPGALLTGYQARLLAFVVAMNTPQKK